MTTTAANIQSYAYGKLSLPYPVELTSFDINQGDLVYFDASSHTIKPADTDAHCATFAGVAQESSFLNLYGTKTYTDSATIQVHTDGRFSLQTTASDTLNHGDPVYIGADAQTITNTANGATHKVGYVWLRPGQTAVTGASGTYVDVLITPLFPVTGGI